MRWAVMAIFVFQAVSSVAQTPDRTKIAMAFVVSGLAKQKAGEHQKAIELFDDAIEIVAHPKFKYFKANSLRALGKLEEALALYEEVVDKPKLEKYTQDTKDQIKTLTARLGFSTVRITTGKITGADVYIDGRRIGSTPFESQLMKKKYKLKVLKSGYHDVERTIEVKGQQPVVLDLELREIVETTEKPVVTEPPVAVAQRAAPRVSPVWKWVTIGLGVAVAAGGAGLQASAASLSNEANDLDPGKFDTFAGYWSEYSDKFSSADSRLKGAYAMYAIGGAAIVGGVLWLVLDKPRPRPGATVVHPTVGERFVGVEATVRF